MNDDAGEILRLDTAWNEAYRRHDRAPLARILADDFAALDASGNPVTKTALMIHPATRARSATFSEQVVHVFGDAAVSHGRLQVELDDRRIDQWFLRVYARRNGKWQAVSVSVTPVPA